MTNAEYIEQIIKDVIGNNFSMHQAAQEGNPFEGCYGIECPKELMDEYEICKCKECPYRNIWGKKVKHGRKIQGQLPI